MNYKLLLPLACLSLGLAAQNPIVPQGVYIADPSSRVMPDGRLYVYGSTDLEPRKYCSNIYHVLSTDNALEWKLTPNSFVWNETLYAPDMMHHRGTYYLYFDTPNGNEYVATSKSPTGPFDQAVQIEGPRQIDPNIFIDDDGQAYYFWGQFSAKGARMNPDMKTLDLSSVRDSILTEDEHHFHEGSYVIRRGRYYYYIYADISRRGRPTSLGYAMATSPLGPYEYKGIIIDNFGCDPASWNNHGSIVKFRGQWYVLYHRSTHNCRAMRKACIEPIHFNSDGTINEVEMTSQGAGRPLDAFSPITADRCCFMKGNVRLRRTEFSPDREELGAIRSGDLAAWKYLDFGRGTKLVTIRLKSQAGGQILLRTDGPDGPVVGTIQVSPETAWTDIQAPLSEIRGKHALWMEFAGSLRLKENEELFRIDRFTFSHK